MAENACSHLYVVPKRHIAVWANVISSGKFLHDNDRQNWIISESFGAEESSSYFIFIDELAFKSISSICILLGIFIIFCLLRQNWFINASMQSSSLPKLRQRLSNETCNKLIIYVYFAKQPRSAAYSLCSAKCGNWHKSSFSNWEANIFYLILDALISFTKPGNNSLLPCRF